MSVDRYTAGLMADVDAIHARIEHQLTEDPGHEVALAMFQADLRRAKAALAERTTQLACARVAADHMHQLAARRAA